MDIIYLSSSRYKNNNLFRVAPAYHVSFSQLAYSINEGSEQVMPVLIVDRPPTTNITVAVSTMDGSATSKHAHYLYNRLLNFNTYVDADQDYSSGQYDITFNAGEDSVSFSISVIDDQILEHDEFFTLGLSLLSINVILGDISQAIVTILNDDSKCCMYAILIKKSLKVSTYVH